MHERGRGWGYGVLQSRKWGKPSTVDELLVKDVYMFRFVKHMYRGGQLKCSADCQKLRCWSCKSDEDTTCVVEGNLDSPLKFPHHNAKRECTVGHREGWAPFDISGNAEVFQLQRTAYSKRQVQFIDNRHSYFLKSCKLHRSRGNKHAY
jgi:hypothetical protein